MNGMVRMSDPVPRHHITVVLAADGDDYWNWCLETGRQPFTDTMWAISSYTAQSPFTSRTFLVTPRWRERSENRDCLTVFQADGVPYGDVDGPWPPERIPELSWPRQRPFWRRLFR